jgi:hypothetical protein
MGTSMTRQRSLLLSAIVVLLLGLAGFLSWWLPSRPEVLSTHRPLPPPTASTGKAAHVLLVSIDGLRPDAIRPAEAEHLLQLMKTGSYSLQAETISPSITLPSHASMVTGLDVPRHGVVWNAYQPGFLRVPSIFTIAMAAERPVALLFSKDKFHYLVPPGGAHWVYGPPPPSRIPSFEDVTRMVAGSLAGAEGEEPGDRSPPEPWSSTTGSSAWGIAHAFAREWETTHYALTFIHFREPDLAGHARGWMGPDYLQAVEIVDGALGLILETIRKSGEWEKTAVLVTADHGGRGRGHFEPGDPKIPENVHIPWICVGPGVPPGLEIPRAIRTVDTAPTVLALLGLPVPADWDGRPVPEVLRVGSPPSGPDR